MRVSVFIPDPLVGIDTETPRVYITNGPWLTDPSYRCDDPYNRYAYDPSAPKQLEIFLAVAKEYELTEEATEALKMIGIEK